ncbi:MAG: DEAD/DEAH box helicase [Rhodospirillales bacterium]|nr:DEAD/DEAH box helicase [Rhodospirillales bacterium]
MNDSPSEPITVSPAQEPGLPTVTFHDLGLGEEILKAIDEVGYVVPTPIQAQAIPIVLMGRDVLGTAQTGTGKTASFVLPMLEMLGSGRARARMPRSLILEPTRELAAQVAENFDLYGKYHKLSQALLIGGESYADQEKLLDRGVDVLIATPGRLIDHFERGRILLSDVKILVIDEADRMLDMGFIPDVEKIVGLLPPLRQTLFFSATMPPEIQRLADAFLTHPKRIAVSAPSAPAATVIQAMIEVDELDKREALRRLLVSEEVKTALIFCNRKKTVTILYRSLKRHGFHVAELHGDMPQSARTETLEKFKAGEISLLVCSDVAARGIDIQALPHVFNFDVPYHAEDYVHRIGRTGRAGREGRSFTIATPDDGKFIAAIERLIGRAIPKVALEGMPLPEASGEERPARERPERKGRGDRGGRGGRERGGRERGERGGRERGGRERRPETAAPLDPADAPQPDYHEEPRHAEPRPTHRDESRPSHRDEPRHGPRGEPRHGQRDRQRPARAEEGEERPSKIVGFGEDIPRFLLTTFAVPKPRRKDEAEESDEIDEIDESDEIEMADEADTLEAGEAYSAIEEVESVDTIEEIDRDGPPESEDEGESEAEAESATAIEAEPEPEREHEPKHEAGGEPQPHPTKEV